MRLAAARAASGSSPEATAACPHPSPLPRMNVLPSGDAAKATSSGFGASGSARWNARPWRPNSQPMPVAPGPYRLQCSESRWVCVSSSRARPAPPCEKRISTQLTSPAELPCEREMPGPPAGRDRTPRVAFQLIAAARSEFSADRQEPTWEPLAAGYCVPKILQGCRVTAGEGDRTSRLSITLQHRHRAIHGGQVFSDIEVHGSFLLLRSALFFGSVKPGFTHGNGHRLFVAHESPRFVSPPRRRYHPYDRGHRASLSCGGLSQGAVRTVRQADREAWHGTKSRVSTTVLRH